MWWISFICFILCFSTSSDFILSLFSFISSFQLLLLLSWRLSVCAWRGRQVRPRLAVSASVFPHKTSTSRPAGCSRQVHTHLDIWPHKIPLFSIVLSFPLKFHTRHSLLCSDWLDHKEALILIKMQLLLPRLFLKPTSCFVVLPHMSLKHCLILRWCSWLARLQLFLLLFFFLYACVVYLKSSCLCFGLSSLILVMIEAFCNCECVYVSVSSFVKKTTEKINTLQMNSDLWPRPDLREGVQGEVTATVTPLPEEGEHEWVTSAAIGGFIYIYIVCIVVFDCLSL